MNFNTVMEELNKLYEADELAAEAEKASDPTSNHDQGTEPELEEKEPVTEAVEEPEIVEEEPSEVAEIEEAQVVLECSKCGALVIKAEKDVAVDEATDLANIEETCQFCEETAGFVIKGILAPYGDGEEIADEAVEDEVVEECVQEPLTEGKIADLVKKVGTRLGADAATVLRSFAELGAEIKNIGKEEWEDTKLLAAAENLENKAVLKALESGNEKVLNSLTKEDIDELKQDIAEYEEAKKVAKAK